MLRCSQASVGAGGIVSGVTGRLLLCAGTQTWEQLEAVQARRSRPVLTELATFELQLPDGWEQDPPSRLDMCSRCAKLLEQVDGFCMGGVRAGAARGGCGFGAMQLSAAARRASLLCASDTRCADEC